MSTIDYIRRLHEGDVFYFGSYYYSKDALHAMPSMHAQKLGRRATNYFLLGHSLPTLLDLNSNNPLEFLKALTNLLAEFETYQTLSGFDASGNAVSRGRMGQMFKSGMGLGGRSGKGRRSSTAILPTDLGTDTKTAEHHGGPHSTNHHALSPHDTASINPTGHEFAFLLTPHISFEPDFNTTLGTLCDTLIDTYGKLMDLVSSPDSCTPAVGEAFSKADKAIRKILVANVVREFEDTTRAGIKAEMAGVGKLALGGLM
jgi:flavin-binding protein dodecin